jgi:hypothetical protein
MRRILITALTLLALAGCSSSNDANDDIATVNGSAQPTASPSKDDPVALAHCMQQHNVPVSDPPTDGEWRLDKPSTVSRETFEAALQACRALLPEGMIGGPPDPADLEKLRTFAVCMREHGIEMSDPEADGNMKIRGRLEHVTRAQLEADPQFKAAFDACKDKLPVDEGKKE